MDVTRILFRFRKEGHARFLSHHDLLRLFERAFRRAALPLRMTEGFNPHPRFAILLALPLGVEATDEPLELHLRSPVEPTEALERLRAQMPAGLALTTAQLLPPEAHAQVESVVYEAELPPEVALEADAIERLLARESLVVDRTTPKGRRSLDLRPALAALRRDGRRLVFELRVAAGGTPKPSEVLAALLGPEQAAHPALRVRRTQVNLAVTSRGSAPARNNLVK